MINEKSSYYLDLNNENIIKTSRYNNLRRIVYEDGTSIISTQKSILIEKSSKDIFYTVKAGEEGRLDLISFKHYNNPLYWWVIAYASDIFDPLSVEVGTVLRIPEVSDVIGPGGVLL